MAATEHRRSIRLQDYDYSQPGAYFITLCGNRAFTEAFPFSLVAEGRVELTSVGIIIEQEWLRTSGMRPGVLIDAYVVMPTHMHAILTLAPPGGQLSAAETVDSVFRHGPASGSVGAILTGFKAAVTSRVRRIAALPDAAVWQRNYFEHVVRTQQALAQVREYIKANPARWDLDRYNAARTGPDELGQSLWQQLKDEST